jgi:aquaporin Z
MNEPETNNDKSAVQERKWAMIRLGIGMAQMIAGLCAVLLVVQGGINWLSLAVLYVASVFTLTSLILFRGPPAETRSALAKKVTSEFLGTFALVFAGTGAIVINDVSGGVVSHVGVSLTFGLVVVAMIYAFGDISGAHLDPAVTLGFFVAQRLSARHVLPYVFSQSLGAASASMVLRFLFPTHVTLGSTLPAGSAAQSFVLELLLTFFLMLVILSVSTGAKEKGITAGIAVGSVIGLEALFAGPICGASMNPARSLAPGLVSLHLETLWIYLTAPVAGALLAVLACRCVREESCCCSASQAGKLSL